MCGCKGRFRRSKEISDCGLGPFGRTDFVFSRVIYKSALHFTMHDASREVHDRRDTHAAAGVNCWVCGNHTVTVFPFTPRSSQAICSSAIAML
jgi:hypothetical protein